MRGSTRGYEGTMGTRGNTVNTKGTKSKKWKNLAEDAEEDSSLGGWPGPSAFQLYMASGSWEQENGVAFTPALCRRLRSLNLLKSAPPHTTMGTEQCSPTSVPGVYWCQGERYLSQHIGARKKNGWCKAKAATSRTEKCTVCKAHVSQCGFEEHVKTHLVSPKSL